MKSRTPPWWRQALQRLVPAPVLSVALLGLWLLLNRSLSLGHCLLGSVLALAIPVLTAGLRPLPVRIRRPALVLRLALTVAVDAVQSNLAVVRLLLTPGRRRHPAGFVRIRLALRDPNALAVLAVIACITPGTAWAELAPDRSLLLHVLELDDAGAIAAHIQQRYERPLMEIFE
ncbi:Na+/H+ antiporter subunit E [Verminephrobacter eiseniae]|uniref:Cation antiporter n=1 Tax=Verminephrobacter eiseniae (strain EF01-2) TaxID=391735 RepID=A1WPQ6_VEREI|nr:Na+/H+ antiporter subunit E [Verminephrobacter eiseniae]ABM59613.1 cation antiporter [Verminephrobacter eiseniae EF01-2]MCW5285129.1 Na+/H+ antiporter subunit E [Verminephrobacter eiseniae]MCW5302837.1 Na+/H+ antiporter subunit E [Verminephrobacter eiseniae]MCW8180722.1 Na+/H+ antiporter subunit E [Verminephrobacter eiseniae]MCW8192185.1 Na+/H+ antiporter subunit E [Verminephrobacter eiseniae]